MNRVNCALGISPKLKLNAELQTICARIFTFVNAEKEMRICLVWLIRRTEVLLCRLRASVRTPNFLGVSGGCAQAAFVEQENTDRCPVKEDVCRTGKNVSSAVKVSLPHGPVIVKWEGIFLSCLKQLHP